MADHALFVMRRLVDSTGVSGTGIVAEGCQFSDGRCVIRWVSDHRSTAVYDSVDDLIAIHGHHGATLIEWAAPRRQRGAVDDSNELGQWAESDIEAIRSMLWGQP